MIARLLAILKAICVTSICSVLIISHTYAEEIDYSADGQRRAKTAGEALIGQAAPSFEITTIDGQKINLAEVYGHKPVYIKFWATWCIPCREQMPGFEAIYTEYQDQIQVISVNTGINDNLKSVSAFVKRMGLTMPTTIDDGTLARAFHLRVTPQHVVIDRDGKFAYFGHVDDAELHQQLQRVVAQQSAQGAVNKTVFSEEKPGYGVGEHVSALALSTISQREMNFKFNQADSKTVGLVFFGPWCEWYLEETAPETSLACGRLRELLESKADASSIDWVTISTNVWSSVPELEEYKKSYQTTLPIVFDQSGDIFKRFGVNQIPTIVLINKNGEIYSHSSIQDDDFYQVMKSISAMN